MNKLHLNKEFIGKDEETVKLGSYKCAVCDVSLEIYEDYYEGKSGTIMGLANGGADFVTYDEYEHKDPAARGFLTCSK